MRNYVIINGVNSLTIQGLAIKTMPPITKPIQRTLREEIDGRDGDIVTPLGYGAYDKTIEIGLFGTFDIDKVIAYFNQKGTITFSNEADKVYYFQALEQVDYAELLKFRTANVVLHCQPFKYPLEEEPLVAQYQYVTNTGSNMSLDNTANALFNKFDLLGNTEQTQYTGKNLIGTNYITGVTINDTTTNDITIRGNWASTIVSNANLLNILEPSTTYTISYKYKVLERPSSFGSNNSVYILGLYDGGSGLTFFGETQKNTIALNTWGTITKTFTTPASLTNYRMIAYDFKDANNTTTGAIELNELQIEKGSSATSFETYVGGTASPNPSYPSPINVVSGDNTIKVTGRNQASSNFEDYTQYDAAYAIMPIHLKPNTLYTLKCRLIGEQKSNYYNYGIVKDGDKYSNFVGLTTTIQYSSGQGGTTTFTTTSEWTNPKLVCYLGNSNQETKFNELFTNYEIEFVEGQPTTYEPYTGQTYPINLGVENLLNKELIVSGNTSNYEVTQLPTGVRLLHKNSYSAGVPTLTLTLKPNTTYTYSQKTNATSGDPGIGIKTTNGSYSYLTTGSKTITTESDGNIIILYGASQGSGVSCDYTDIQLEEGSKANSYTPYGTTPIELCKIGTYQDYIYKEDGSWYLHKEIGKVVLDGSESGWALYNASGTAPRRFGLYQTKWYKNSIPLLSDYFIGGEYNSQVDLSIWTQTSYLAITDKNSKWANAVSLQTWLASNNVTVYYVLETPTTEEITDEDLIAQLEATKQASSYDGQTNISQENNDLPFVLDLSALKENSDHLVIDNIGNIYSKPTLDLEGTGIVDIYLNDTQMFEVDLSEKNEIVIDTEKMEAYNPTDNTLANRQVTGDYSKFKLDSGENDLRFSGDLTKATITNYERWL